MKSGKKPVGDLFFCLSECTGQSLTVASSGAFMSLTQLQVKNKRGSWSKAKLPALRKFILKYKTLQANGEKFSL